MDNNSAATTFTAYLPDGRVITRTSKTREYIHVVISQDARTGEWGVHSWSQSGSAANKKYQQVYNRSDCTNVRIIDCYSQEWAAQHPKTAAALARCLRAMPHQGGFPAGE